MEDHYLSLLEKHSTHPEVLPLVTAHRDLHVMVDEMAGRPGQEDKVKVLKKQKLAAKDRLFAKLDEVDGLTH